MELFSLSPKAWEPRGHGCKSRTRKVRESGALKYKDTWEERGNLSFPCLSVILGPQWIGWGWMSLPSLLIQMLISSTITLTGAPRNKDLAALLALVSPVRLTLKNNYYSHHYILETNNLFPTFTSREKFGPRVNCTPSPTNTWFRRHLGEIFELRVASRMG